MHAVPKHFCGGAITTVLTFSFYLLLCEKVGVGISGRGSQLIISSLVGYAAKRVPPTWLYLGRGDSLFIAHAQLTAGFLETYFPDIFTCLSLLGLCRYPRDGLCVFGAKI